MRRDAEGAYRVGPTWESVTERLIREAHEAGDFDDLPGRGRRLTLDDDPREGDMGLVFHLLRNDRAVPPWIAADRDARQHAQTVEAILAAAAQRGPSGRVDGTTRARFRARLERAVEDHARAVDALAATAPSATLHRQRLQWSALLARLERALDGCADPEPRP